MFRLCPLLIALLAADARPAGASPAPAPLPTARCPQLFGSRAVRRRNKALRERFLRWTRRDASGITVAHSHRRWERVIALHLRGLAVEQRGDAALVSLSPALAKRLGCAAGRYLLRRDDALGGHTRALALLGDVVLVVHRGQLAYLAAAGAREPRWLLAWQLWGVTVRPKLGPPRRRPRAKKKKRRPRRRKRRRKR